MFCPECGEQMPGRPTGCLNCHHRIEYLADQVRLETVKKAAVWIATRSVIIAIIVAVTYYVVVPRLTPEPIVPSDPYFSQNQYPPTPLQRAQDEFLHQIAMSQDAPLLP